VNYRELEQGDIIYLDFDPAKGHEQKGLRPCIVLTKPHRFLGYMFGVAPISNTLREYPLHLPIPDGLKTTGKVLLDQHRMVDIEERGFAFVEKPPADFVRECVIKLKLLY